MRVLFLDDDHQRHQAFRRNAIGVELDAAFTYDEAVVLLDKHVYDAAFLDHDLSFEAAMGTAPSDEKTGYHVAEFIVGLPQERRPRFVCCHSFNPLGSQRMAWLLDQAGVEVIRQTFNKELGPKIK